MIVTIEDGMSAEDAVEMFVGGLVLDPSTQAPVVVLKDESGAVCLPIWIGVAEATSIATAIKQVQMERPLTHDLMFTIFGQMDVRVERVVITELKDSTYYAELIVSRGDQAFILDSRPSDAIALALRASAPIFVAQSVLEQAKITFEAQSQSGREAEGTGEEESSAEGMASESGEAGGEAEGEAGEGGETDSPMPAADFSPLDKEQWEKILAELDPDDFKYKV